MSGPPLLEVRDLSVSFRTQDGTVHAVDGVSFTVNRGEVLGIVGESGSGKSVTAMTLMRLILDQNAVFSGEVLFNGRDLMQLSQRDMLQVRGKQISMIFQDPMTSLNPVYRVGWQIDEQLRAHEGLSAKQARRRTLELLGAVGIPNPEARIDDYPHQFSGGMRQRVMIAMGTLVQPRRADRRRADHGARRHHPGPDPRADREPAARVRLGRGADHARPRRRCRGGRQGGRDVRGPDRRVRRGGRAVPRPAAPLHLGPAGIDLADGPAPAEAAGGHHGPAAVADLAAGGLQLPAPLPARLRPLPRRAPDAVARSGAGHLDACFLPADEKLARQVAEPEAS